MVDVSPIHVGSVFKTIRSRKFIVAGRPNRRKKDAFSYLCDLVGGLIGLPVKINRDEKTKNGLLPS